MNADLFRITNKEITYVDIYGNKINYAMPMAINPPIIDGKVLPNPTVFWERVNENTIRLFWA